MRRCKLISNWVSGYGGGWTYGGGGAFGGVLDNCVVISNRAFFGGGAAESILNNCTVVRNSADWDSFPRPMPLVIYPAGGGAYSGSANNCIVVFNYTPPNSFFSNYAATAIGGGIEYSCTLPSNLYGDEGNIFLDPLFSDLEAGDLRLQSNSPCINAGNNAFVGSATDYQGSARIFDGAVDMGAYESPVALPLPTLNIVQSGQNVVLSWPVWAHRYTLEVAESLSTPTHWTSGWRLGKPVATNGEFLLGVPKDPVTRSFYRLRLSYQP